MYLYNTGGLSSSLLTIYNGYAPEKGYSDVAPATSHRDPQWRESSHQRPLEIVPVIPMKLLLKSIPKHIAITHLHTDMQGMDFAAIRSAGSMIKRVKSIQTEVHYKTNRIPGYNMLNYTNDFISMMPGNHTWRR